MSAPKSTTGSAVAKGRRPNPRIAQFKRTWYFLSRNTLALVGLGIILFFVAVAAYSFVYNAPSDSLSTYCASSSVQGSNASCINVCTWTTDAPPTTIPPNCSPILSNSPGFVAPTFNLAHLQGGPLPLGSLTVDSSSPYFYSIFAGLVKGAPWSLGISAGIVSAGALIGLMLGSLAGYKGGLADEAIMRFTDIFLSIPGLLLVLVLLAVLGGSIPTLTGRILLLMGAFIITWWPFYTRIVRGQVLVTREQKYVEASRASGAKSGRIILRHIVPNSLFPVFVQMSLDVGSIPLSLGGLAFLGFHLFPTQFFPEWGTLSALSVQVLPTTVQYCEVATCVFPWWQILFPGLTVFLFAISVNFLSDGLRDALDPRLRR
ncbi:MAG: ABC transporter permease [Thermoplasmata archaeon]|nr:ABC transporter permease [Thermoplasmata archaeon]